MTYPSTPGASSRYTRCRWSDRVVEAGTILLLVSTPLAFGTVQPWSEALAEAVIAAMAAAWIIGLLLRGGPRIELPPGSIPIALFLALVFLQAVPMPADFVRLVSPLAVAAAGDASAMTGAIASALPLSLAPHETWRQGVKLASVAVLFLILFNARHQREQTARLVWTMILMGAAIALFGVAQRATWTGRLYWVGPEASIVAAFGPFVNRTHFNGLMLVVIPLALALVLPARPGSGRRPPWSARWRQWADDSRGTALAVVLIVAMGAIALANGSRGGVLSLIAALVIMLGLGARWRGSERLGAALAAGVVLVVLAGLWIAGDVLYGSVAGLARELAGPEVASRLQIWRDALGLWRETPVVGTGLGSFDVAFPRVRTLPGPYVYTHAESDWVQLLVESGAIGLGLAALALVLAGSALLLRCRRAAMGAVRCYALAGVVMLAGTALLGATNFTLPIMSNLLYLAVAVALALRAGSGATREAPAHGAAA